MNFKIYQNKQELLCDNQEILRSGLLSATQLTCLNNNIAQFKSLSPYSYALKFTDGDAFLLLVRGDKARSTLLFGGAKLAYYAANIVADYHLHVGGCVGEAKLIEAFCQSYQHRLGGVVELARDSLDSQHNDAYVQINYRQSNIRQALFAGGCFWCMAKPYYEYDGVLKVLSGYAGGSEVNPTYEQVKHALTHHKETVMLEYDSNVISFSQLLDIYFDTIDPFDEYGQFIDRGDNYTCAIFTDDVNERQTLADYICHIESQFNRKVQVAIANSAVFYKAEEYHQDYALKNAEAMAEELETSGRLVHKPLKTD